MPPTSQATADGHFLGRWFQSLANRVLVSDRHASDPHNVRVQASSTSDWWIQVQQPPTERCHGCGYYATHEQPSRTTQEHQLRELCEALVLLTMHARVDYDSWLEEMKATSALRFLHEDRLECRFSFVVGGELGQDGSYPCELLADVLADANHQYSVEFQNAYASIQTRGKKLGVEPATLRAPISIRLQFSQLTVSPECNVDTLAHMADAYSRILQSKHGNSLFSPFELDCVELRLRSHELNAVTLASIHRIVDTGVQICHLELPGRLSLPINQVELHQAWYTLAHKLFRPSADGALAINPQIERLELPPVYFATDLAASWLPLLTTASNVRSLTIDGGVGATESLHPSDLSLAWVYLGYAMFSADSNNSIESFHVRGISSIENDVIALFGRVAASRAPLVDLWQVLESHPHASPGQASPFTDCSHRSELHTPLPNKLRRLVLTAVPLDAVDGDPTTVISLITQVLRRAGAQLTDLAIDGAPIDEVALRECLKLCPRLKSLRLNGARLGSLEPLVYFSSLNLQAITTPQQTVVTFLERLQAGGPASLERLRIGEGWSGHMDASTPQILDDMLSVNQSLSYLHVFRPNDVYSALPSAAWNHLKVHNGTLIASRDRPLAFDCKIAFLASAHKVAETTLTAPLNQDVLTHVFQFAARPRQRTVLIESDIRSSLY